MIIIMYIYIYIHTYIHTHKDMNSSKETSAAQDKFLTYTLAYNITITHV